MLSASALHRVPSLSLLDISSDNFYKSLALQKLFSSEIFSGLDILLLLNISHNDISSHLLSEDIFTGLHKLALNHYTPT